jgi:hypothetical protein
MKDTFDKLDIGDYFLFSNLGLCVKTRPELLCSVHGVVLYNCNAMLLNRRTPIPVYEDDIIEHIDVAVIGHHIWFPAYCAACGGEGPYEIAMIHDKALDLSFIPVKMGMLFEDKTTRVTGLLEGAWTFVSYAGLVPYQQNFKVITSKV